MTKITYFDTNVFDHIRKGIGVTNAECQSLRSALSRGKVSVLLSFLNLEEVLCLLPQSHDEARSELRLILELCEKSRLVQPAGTMLNNDIRSYVDGKASPAPFMPLDSVIRENLGALIEVG